VAAQYQPTWGTVRDFLTPNDYWHPKSLKRLRRPLPADAAKGPAETDTAVTR
jgi:hypothetical protein